MDRDRLSVGAEQPKELTIGGKHDVIVCVHNALEDVTRCLEALARHWRTEGLDRLIVVDDASDPNTARYLRAFGEKHSYAEINRNSTRLYYTRSANVGLKSSTAIFKTLLNSDTIAPLGWARAVRSAFSQYPCLGIVGPLSNAAGSQSVPMIEGGESQTAVNVLPPDVTIEGFAAECVRFSKGVPSPFVPLVHGFCFTVQADVFEEIGYLDEQIFPRGYGEECDYCFRADDAGFVLAIALDAFVFHRKSRSYTDRERADFMKAGMKALVGKHSERRVRAAVNFMERNPMLVAMRREVATRWPHHTWK